MGLSLTDKAVIGGGVLLALGVVYIVGRGAGKVAEDVSRTAVNVAGGVVKGTVDGVSDAIGLQVPERSACDKAKAEGNTWEASFACPAGEFVGYLFN